MDGNLKKLAEAAEIIHPGLGAWVYGLWGEYNERYFHGAMKPCGIAWGLTPHGRSLGHYSPWVNQITLHESLVAPKGDAWGISHKLGKPFAADVLLHEMVHQYVYTVLGIPDGGLGASPGGHSSHNNPYWVGEVNRISPLLGLDCRAVVIRQKRVDGKVAWFMPEGYLRRAQTSTWPYSVTPDSYYLGETPRVVQAAPEPQPEPTPAPKPSRKRKAPGKGKGDLQEVEAGLQESMDRLFGL